MLRLAVPVLGIACALLGGVALSTLPTSAPKAAKDATATYLIPASEGYGVADCLATKSDCGGIVAKAWCEAKGYKLALDYGVADKSDFTGSVPVTGVSSKEPPLAITCGS